MFLGELSALRYLWEFHSQVIYPLRRLIKVALSAYKIGERFKCLLTPLSIPWSKVNDDYCDCPDGSDEPGSSACPNGSFFCRDVQYKVVSIPSNFVNDGYIGKLIGLFLLVLSKVFMK